MRYASPVIDTQKLQATMLDRLIRFSLEHRALVLAAAAIMMAYGVIAIGRLPVDVLPDLNRPTVTIMTEAEGYAPQEVEVAVSRPIEQAMAGATDVERVRSVSGIGLSVVYVEFAWGSDIYRNRQLVTERLQSAGTLLPMGITPKLGPISSIMGQVVMIGLSSDTTSPVELRRLADAIIRPRLLTVPGVAQVIPIGGVQQQFQVLLAPTRLRAAGVTLNELEAAVRSSGTNTTGGFIRRGAEELLVRNVARASSPEEIAQTVIRVAGGVPVTVGDVARVVRGGAITRRGDASINARPAVIISVEKQPSVDVGTLTRAIDSALAGLHPALPHDAKLEANLFRQAEFVERAVDNVEEALRDGAILVTVVLIVFLLNIRTTAITLTAIPLSIAVTAIVFEQFGLSINTMTLGGIAVAIGELVDDAIVDVENVFRRLRENHHSQSPLPARTVVARASSEVRNSIVYATILVVLVFLPLFSLEGMEGRIFAPLGIAYVLSITASLLISLTVTPALASFLLPGSRAITRSESDGPLVRMLKRWDRRLLGWTLHRPSPVIGATATLFAGAILLLVNFGSEFLPPFNEGSLTINLSLSPGAALEESNRVGIVAERLLLAIPEVTHVGRRSGRAELDEHAEGVQSSEIDVGLRESERSRDEVLADIRKQMALLPGVAVNIGQPISHRLDHLLSGVRAQIAVKVFGEDLATLRKTAAEVREAMAGVPGITDLAVEQQTLIPQLVIEVDRGAAARYGLAPQSIVEQLETALNGRRVGDVVEGNLQVPIVLRADSGTRRDPTAIGSIMLATPDGNQIPASVVAHIDENATGPNQILHENGARRIVVLANASGRALSDVVADARARVAQQVDLSTGSFISWEGQFESQQSAVRKLALLGALALVGMIAVLYAHFRSMRIVLQVLLNIPLALIGSVAAIALSGGVISVATIIGFITLTGIASRNGIMMIAHYFHLVREEGESFSDSMIVRGSLERLVPVLMTAVTAGLALVPLALSADAPGKEILHPVAVVILGGLVSSTLLDVVVTPVVFRRFGRPAIEQFLAGQLPSPPTGNSHG